MNGDMYEIVALAMRYFFAGLMALIAMRAWKITIVDSRRASDLRRMSPETGLCGEFLVVTGDGRAREGMRYPVIREGLIGSSRKADVRLRSRTVRRSHAFFELTECGLRMRNHNRSAVYSGGRSRREVLLRDGDHVTVGHVELMLVLNVPVSAPQNDAYDDIDAVAGREAAAADIFDLNALERPEEAPATVSDPGPSRGSAGGDAKISQPPRPADARDDDIRIYKPRRGEPIADPAPEERRDEFDSWLDMTETDEWDADEAPPAAPSWDGEWDESPRKKRPEKRRPSDDADDFFNV